MPIYGDTRGSWKFTCVAAATTDLDLDGTETIDGVAVVAGDYVLAAGQSTASENGIYEVAAGAWTRRGDFDESDEQNLGSACFVYSGDAFSGVWAYTATNTWKRPSGVRVMEIPVGFADLTAAATTETLDIYTMQGAAGVMDAFIVLATPFTGGGASTCTISLGEDSSPDVDAYILAKSIFSGGGLVGVALADKGADLADNKTSALVAADAVTATVVSDVNVADLTAGALTVVLIIAEM